MMPHDQHRDSLWQNKKEMPEVEGQVVPLRCLLKLLLAAMLAPPLPGLALIIVKNHIGPSTLVPFSFFLAPYREHFYL